MRVIKPYAAFLCLSFGLLLTAACAEIDREDRAAEEAGRTAPDAQAPSLDMLPRELVLVNYELERGQEVITGSVMNNSNQPYVNIQVEFDLYNAEAQRVASVGDTLREIWPGETLQFSIPIEPGQDAARAVQTRLEGTPRPAGMDKEQHYPQNEPEEVTPGEGAQQ